MAKDGKKDLEELSNEKLGAMFTPLPYRETDPMERYRQVGNVITGILVIGFLLYLAFY